LAFAFLLLNYAFALDACRIFNGLLERNRDGRKKTAKMKRKKDEGRKKKLTFLSTLYLQWSTAYTWAEFGVTLICALQGSVIFVTCFFFYIIFPAVFYFFGTWPRALRKENRLSVFENRVPRRIFAEMIGD
jgi:hypothetical protein